MVETVLREKSQDRNSWWVGNGSDVPFIPVLFGVYVPRKRNVRSVAGILSTNLISQRGSEEHFPLGFIPAVSTGRGGSSVRRTRVDALIFQPS